MALQHDRNPADDEPHAGSVQRCEYRWRHGWMASGDLGRFDDEGYLYIVDRKKDMVVSGGANVFPAEIEEVIARHPGVLEVAVVGVPHETWGERCTRWVVPVPGRELDLAELEALCERDLAGYKRPKSFELASELPKTGAGKILKRVLLEAYWEGEDVAVG